MKITFQAVIALALVTSSVSGAAARPREREKYSLTEGERIEIPAKKTLLPLLIHSEERGVTSSFVPSGYMGDRISIKTTAESAPLKVGVGQASLQITYPGHGREGWAGVYWLTPANNWGKIKGAGYDLSAAKKITFWARGDHGGEYIAEFKMGGIIGAYPDTDLAQIGPIRLGHEWKQYTINLEGKDLRHIVGGFAFILKRADNPRGAVFFLDEVMFEGENVPESAADSSSENMPTETAASTTTLASPALDKPVTITVSFASARTLYDPESQMNMDQMVALANQFPLASLRVEGHTDDIGPERTNEALSVERAKAVADYLVEKGVEQARIQVVGMGEERPLTPESNKTPEGRAKNRRVEMVLMP